MLDNNNLIPGEAFTAAEKLVDNVVDKITSAIGWVFVPKGNKKYQLESENYLIEQIKNDKKMPALAKAASICKVRKLMKEYINQQNIFDIAMKSLACDARPEDVEDDWLSNFFEKAKIISKNDIAIIFGKLLAEEINNPGTVSKSLIHILSLIERDDAKAFVALANFCVFIDGEYFPIIYTEEIDIYMRNDLGMGIINNLVDIGLIQREEFPLSFMKSDNTDVFYFDTKIDIGDVKELCIGNIILTKPGRELIAIITDKKKIKGFAEFISSRITKELGGILELGD